MRRFPHTVTFQQATKTRSPAGQETLTYSNVTGLTDLPALVIAVVTEDQGERMVLERDLYRIIVEGDRAIEPGMAAMTDYASGVFDIIRVVRPVAPMPMATIVTTERVQT